MNQVSQEGTVTKAEIKEGILEIYKGVAIVKIAEKQYTIVMAKSRICEKTFKTKNAAKLYVRNNEIEIAINAMIAILNDVYNIKIEEKQ